MAGRVSGRRYALRPEPREASPLEFDVGHGLFEVTRRWVSFDFGPEGSRLTFCDDRGIHELACRHGVWRHGVSTPQSTDGVTAPREAASGAWTAEDTFQVVCWLDAVDSGVKAHVRHIERRRCRRGRGRTRTGSMWRRGSTRRMPPPFGVRMPRGGGEISRWRRGNEWRCISWGLVRRSGGSYWCATGSKICGGRWRGGGQAGG